MSWALQFDGVNDYALFASPVANAGAFTYVIKFKFNTVATNNFVMGASTSTGNWVGLFSGSFTIRAAGGSFSLPGSPLADTWYTLTIERTADNTVNVSEPILGSVSGTRSGEVLFDQFGRYSTSTSLILDGQIELVTLSSSESNNNWDATASSHVAGTPILTDTIGGNDATGVNMPTDGSAWIDLGGSGISLTVDSGTYSQAGTATPLKAELNILTTSGSYLLTGSDVNLKAARKLITETGSYNLTGTDVNLIYTPGGGGEILVVDSGVYSLAGDELLLSAQLNIISNSGNYLLSGTETRIAYNANIVHETNSYSIIGSDVNLFANYGMIVLSTSYTLTGTSVTLKYSGDTNQIIGTVTAGFAPDLYSAGYKPNTITVTFKE